jgi:hypothetical protein
VPQDHTHRPLSVSDRLKLRAAIRHLKSPFHSIRQAAHTEIRKILARYERGRSGTPLLRRLFPWLRKRRTNRRDIRTMRRRQRREAARYPMLRRWLRVPWSWLRERGSQVQERYLRRLERKRDERMRPGTDHRAREVGRKGWGGEVRAADRGREQAHDQRHPSHNMRPIARSERSARDLTSKLEAAARAREDRGQVPAVREDRAPREDTRDTRAASGARDIR